LSGLRLGAYRSVLRSPGAPRLVAAALVGRLPQGMLPLAVLLTVQAATGSFAAAGAVVAAYMVTAGLAAPVQGRLVDRLGQTAVLVPCTVVFATGFTAVAAGAAAGLPPGALAGLAALGGLGNPPLAPCLRALWAAMPDRDALLERAYALDSTLQELIFITGPLLVSLFLAVRSPTAALVAAAALSVAGTLLFATAPASRRWRGEPRARHWAGALRAPGIRTVVGLAPLIAGSIGVVEVAVAAFAERRGQPGAAGVLLAMWSVGSMAGGLWYGTRAWAGPVEQRYPRLLLAVALGYVPPLLVAAVWQMGVVLLAAGACIAPLLACGYLLVDRLAPAGTVTEAFTWMQTGFLAGLSGGAAAGGLLIDRLGVRAALAAAVAVALAGAAAARARRPTLRAGRPAHRRSAEVVMHG